MTEAKLARWAGNKALGIRHIVVFLGNKLVSCDTILPVLMELRAQNGALAIRVISLNAASYDAIRENTVLHEGILSIGSFELVGRRRKTRLNWLPHRLRIVWTMLPLLFAAKRRRVVFLHFKALNEWPMRLLYWFSPADTILCESTAAGYREVEQQIAGLTPGRGTPDQRIAAGAMLYFHDGWAPLSMPRYRHLPQVQLPVPYQLGSWRAYVRKRENDDFTNAGLPQSRSIIAYLLGWFGELAFLQNEAAARELFKETLAILIEEGGKLPIVVKPHVISDMRFVSNTIESMSKKSRERIKISNIHPSVLARRSSFFVVNYFSTALLPAACVDVPTVEFSRYSAEALRITGGGSMRPDIVRHFINGDGQAMRSVVRELVGKPLANASPPGAKLPADAMSLLCGGDPSKSTLVP